MISTMKVVALSFAVVTLPIGAAEVAGVQQTAALPASSGSVFISKSEFASKLAEIKSTGTQLAAMGAVKSGHDRINVDQIKRTDPAAEGPVSHTVVTEVYYILEGGGMMETGGTIADPVPMLTNGKPTNPANIGPSLRGTQLKGGTSHHVTVGDVVMIPPGVPHRFLSLDGSVTYLVVRVNPGFEKTATP
jgi:mannose-6-phosphate isomerase-like protein (cupin superfamily)